MEQQEGILDLNQLLVVQRAIKKGNFLPRWDAGGSGIAAEITATVNAIQEQNELFANEVGRVAHEIGHKGMLGGQALLVDSINFAEGQLCHHVRDMTSICEGVDRDEARKVTMLGDGEFALLHDALNSHWERDHK